MSAELPSERRAMSSVVCENEGIAGDYPVEHRTEVSCRSEIPASCSSEPGNERERTVIERTCSED